MVAPYVSFSISPMHAHKNRGFTLIELIIVIVILGVLAVTAAPRFIDLSSDANIATLEGMEGVIKTASQLVFSKAVIQNVHREATATVDLDGDGTGDIDTEYGYPSDARSTGITLALSGDFASEWAWSSRLNPQRVVLTSAGLSQSGAGQKVNNVPITTGNCYITYIGPTAADAEPTVTLTTSGC